MSNLEDPLEAYTGLSLFPQTFSHLPNPPLPIPSDPLDLLAVHNLLLSLPVRNPDKLLEQAKSILDFPSETLTITQMDMSFKEHKEAEKDGRRERRPGLDRKRPRFSLLPNSSKPSVNLEPTLDIDKLKDPDDFFKAFDRLENAKKEIAKQTGRVSLDSNQYSTSVIPRPRRPGIPGRSRKVKYQHLYPIMSSQETSEVGILSASENVSSQEDESLENVTSQQHEQENVESEEMDQDGSVIKAENRISKLLGELLDQDYEELDGDGAVSLLQERLKIKPPVVEKLKLPEMQDIQRIGLEASGSNFKKPRNVLSDIHNLLKGTSKTPKKQNKTESPASSLGSPTPPKSPFGSLLLLKKRTLLSNQPTDPFSAVDIDQSIPQNASPVINISADVEKELSVSGKLRALVIEEDDNSVSNMSSKVAIEDLTASSHKLVNDNLTNLGSDVGPCKSSGELIENNIGVDSETINENLGQHDADSDVQSERPDELEDKADAVVQETVYSAQPDSNMDDDAVKKSNKISSRPAVEDHAMEGYSEVQNDASEQTEITASEQPNEKIQEPSMETNKEKTNRKLTKAKSGRSNRRKDKMLSRRQSLAASGTSWETGQRRSTRIRSRPLEYWKGEKFLYGRVHSSLPTIIGIKYESPGKDNGKATIKVKSFVSDDFKHLVELAAL